MSELMHMTLKVIAQQSLAQALKMLASDQDQLDQDENNSNNFQADGPEEMVMDMDVDSLF